MRVQMLALLTGGLLSILLAAGCGGASDEGTDEVTVSSLSTAEFVKQADAACAKRQDEARAEFVAYGEQVSKPNESTAESEAHIVTVAETIVIPGLLHQAEDIRALGAPKGKQDEVEAVLEAIEAGVARAKLHPRQVIGESSKLLEPAGKLARELGLKVCGTG